MDDGRISGRFLLIAAGVLGLIYLMCLAPGVHVHDAGELTAAAWTLGLAHPPGSPLYMLSAKFFMSVIPFGNIAWRANLFSAIAGIGCFLVLGFWALRRRLPVFSAITVAAVAALAPTFRSQAAMAEVYTLEAFVLACVFLSLQWREKPEITMFLWGLLLTCHVSPAPLTPILILILLNRGHSGLRRIPGMLAALVLPLLLYAYIPLRAAAAPTINWSSPKNLGDYWAYLSNANVRGRSFSLGMAEYVDRSLEFGAILLRNLHVALPIILAGFFRRHRIAVFAWCVIASDILFTVLLDTAPLQSEAYGMTTFVAASILAGLGLEHIAGKPRLRRIATTVLAAAILGNTIMTWGETDLSDSFLVRDRAEAVLDQVPRGGVLFTWEDNMTFPLAYLVAVEGARPELTIYDRAGNLFDSPFDRPLYRVSTSLSEYRKSFEEPLVHSFLMGDRAVVYSEPFCDFQPDSWRLFPSGTVGMALLNDAAVPVSVSRVPVPRAPDEPGWMSRQLLAADALSRAASDHAEGNIEAVRRRLETAFDLADLARLDIRISQLALDADLFDLAETAAKRAVEKQPRTAVAWNLWAHAALGQGRLSEARHRNGRALKLDPDLAAAWLTAGMLQIHDRQWTEAEKMLDRAILLGAGAQALIDRALVREKLGKIPGALADLREASNRGLRKKSAYLRLMIGAGNGEDVGRIRTELCRMADEFPASRFTAGELKHLLLLSARTGAPDCIDAWLDPLLSRGDSPSGRVARAYLEGVGKAE